MFKNNIKNSVSGQLFFSLSRHGALKKPQLVETAAGPTSTESCCRGNEGPAEKPGVNNSVRCGDAIGEEATGLWGLKHEGVCVRVSNVLHTRSMLEWRGLLVFEEDAPGSTPVSRACVLFLLPPSLSAPKTPIVIVTSSPPAEAENARRLNQNVRDDARQGNAQQVPPRPRIYRPLPAE